MTRAFLAEGASVAMLARNPDRLANAAAEFGDRVLAVACDVSNRVAVDEAVAKIITRFGHVDILVNNAGSGLIAPFDHIPIADARSLFETNFFGAFNLTQAILPHMKQRKTGHIVNMSSVAGLRGIPNSSMYCASKAALIAFSDSLRIELRSHGIAITVVCPSRTNDTPFVERARKYGNIELYKVPDGFTTDMVVRATLNAIVRRQRTVIIPMHAKLLHFLNKFTPGIVDNYLHKNMPRLDSNPIMNRLRFWLPSLLWAVTIFVISGMPPLVPPEKKPPLLIPTDKLAHAGAYALLGGLILFALRRAHNARLPKAVALAILLASAYGVSDECHQRFVPNRQASLGDCAADAIGAGLIGCVWYLYESRRSQQTNR
jgi:short-subunit dehydrogenase